MLSFSCMRFLTISDKTGTHRKSKSTYMNSQNKITGTHVKMQEHVGTCRQQQQHFGNVRYNEHRDSNTPRKSMRRCRQTYRARKENPSGVFLASSNRVLKVLSTSYCSYLQRGITAGCSKVLKLDTTGYCSLVSGLSITRNNLFQNNAFRLFILSNNLEVQEVQP